MVYTTYKNGDLGGGLFMVYYCFTMFYPHDLQKFRSKDVAPPSS